MATGVKKKNHAAHPLPIDFLGINKIRLKITQEKNRKIT